jgi:hypothetical protein
MGGRNPSTRLGRPATVHQLTRIFVCSTRRLSGGARISKVEITPFSVRTFEPVLHMVRPNVLSSYPHNP